MVEAVGTGGWAVVRMALGQAIGSAKRGVGEERRGLGDRGDKVREEEVQIGLEGTSVSIVSDMGAVYQKGVIFGIDIGGNKE